MLKFILCSLLVGYFGAITCSVASAVDGQCGPAESNQAPTTYRYKGNLYDVNKLHMVNEDLESGNANDWCKPSFAFSIHAKAGVPSLNPSAESFDVVLLEKDHGRVMIRDKKTCELVTVDANTTSLNLSSYLLAKLMPCGAAHGLADAYLHEKYIQNRMVVDSLTAQNAIIQPGMTNQAPAMVAKHSGKSSGRQISSVKHPNVDYGAGYTNLKH